MPMYIRGRSQRIQRRREIVARMFELLEELGHGYTANTASSPFSEGRKLTSEFTKLLLELTELNAIDDQKISIRK